MQKRLSIKAIAKDLSVSPTTISFILNDKALDNRISQALIDRVKDHIEKIGYQPNQLAKSLRTGKSKMIVFMVEDISNPFFATIAKAIEQRAFKDGYTAIYCSTDNDLEKTRGLIRQFNNLRVDGYIITPPKGLNPCDINQLIKNGHSVILFDRQLPGVECSHVMIDNFQATNLGLKLFVEKDFKKIGFITIDSDQAQMQERLRAYETICTQNALDEYVLEIPFNSYSSLDAEQRIAFFLTENPELEAVFFATNYLAISGMNIFKQLDIKIPEQLVVIAFDDNEFFKLSKPSVTSVVQPQEELAFQLTQIMFNLLGNPNSQEIHHVELPAYLKERESTGIPVVLE